MKTKIPARFFIVTFSWTWFCWLAPMLSGRLGIPAVNSLMAAIGPVLGILASFGPAAGAVVSLLTYDGKGAARKFFKSFLSFNFGWKAWVSIFAIIGGAAFLAWIIPEFFGFARPPKYLPSLAMFPVYFFIMIVAGGGQEEIGWRGYIMTRLENKFGLVFGSLILGAVWAAWHIPLWFMQGTNQIYMNFFAFTIGCIGLSFFFSWIIEASGGRRLSGLIAHGAMNAFMMLFPSIILDAAVPQPRFWLSQIFIFAAGVIVVTTRTINRRGKIS